MNCGCKFICVPTKHVIKERRGKEVKLHAFYSPILGEDESQLYAQEPIYPKKVGSVPKV